VLILFCVAASRSWLCSVLIMDGMKHCSLVCSVLETTAFDSCKCAHFRCEHSFNFTNFKYILYLKNLGI